MTVLVIIIQTILQKLSSDQWKEEDETPIELRKNLRNCEILQKVEDRTKHNNLVEEEGKASSPGQKNYQRE